MFADALDVAMQFTRCTVLSAQKQNGKCVASIGAFMVVNPQGWIVTAAHILTDLINLDREVSASRQRANDQAAIEGDQSLSGGERRRRIAALPKQQPKGNIRYSALWWRPEVRQIVDINLIAGVDIGVGRLEPWEPGWIAQYPVFKDPTRGVRPGKSFCRLGFPFHEFTPSYDAVTNTFNFPPEALPIPIFASEGIISRFLEVSDPGAPVVPFPLKWIETSSPGLKGQSGGPLLDERGTIWGVQSNTFSYNLGFSPQVPRGNPGQKEHQFLNAGRAVHPETMVGFFNQHGVQFNVSAY
jgi:hypothetical protein